MAARRGLCSGYSTTRRLPWSAAHDLKHAVMVALSGEIEFKLLLVLALTIATFNARVAG